MNNKLKASIDFGTNAWKLYVLNQKLEVVHRYVVQSLKTVQSNEIDENHFLKSIDNFSEQFKDYDLDIKNPNDVRLVATQSFRSASNAEDLILKLKTEKNVDIEIITAEKEAELAMKGILNSYPNLKDKNVLAIDFGGGSTDGIFYSQKEKKVNKAGFSVPGMRFLAEEMKLYPNDMRKSFFDKTKEEISSDIGAFVLENEIKNYANDLMIVANSSSVMNFDMCNEFDADNNPLKNEGEIFELGSLVTSIAEKNLTKISSNTSRRILTKAEKQYAGSFITCCVLSSIKTHAGLPENQKVLASIKSLKEGVVSEMFENEHKNILTINKLIEYKQR